MSSEGKGKEIKRPGKRRKEHIRHSVVQTREGVKREKRKSRISPSAREEVTENTQKRELSTRSIRNSPDAGGVSEPVRHFR